VQTIRTPCGTTRKEKILYGREGRQVLETNLHHSRMTPGVGPV
jgi:hypothetical protein